MADLGFHGKNKAEIEGRVLGGGGSEPLHQLGGIDRKGGGLYEAWYDHTVG